MRYLLPALALLATVSCATYNGAAMQSVGDVAVISIQCYRSVATGDDKEWAATAKVWTRAEAFDLAPAAASISTDVFGAFARSLPFKLVGERSLLDSEAYLGLGSGGITLLRENEVTVPTGYLPLSLDNRKGITEVIARFPEVNGFLWAEVKYTLAKKNTFHGTAFARMRADLTLTILDRGGRGILRHTESAEDTTDLRIIAVGMLKLSDVSSAAARATARVSAEMARWLEARNTR
ncbi:MAG: hypothetical protein A2177_10130 [Spirochaetes bacterium RBG_13_68_11]|nr:MAG: hypothetical protein A2177_10130 [Spirochaetes bacterium RBG_13_68_11]